MRDTFSVTSQEAKYLQCTIQHRPVVLSAFFYDFQLRAAQWFPWFFQGPALGHISMYAHTMLPFTVSPTSHTSLTRIITLCTARSPQPTNRNTNIATEEQNVFWALFPPFELS